MQPSDSNRIDLAAVRADTPGVGHVIHLDSAGSSLPPTVVLDTQVRYLEEEASAGGYETSERHTDDVVAVYDAIGALVGADTDEIALTSNATESWQLAFHSIRLAPGDRVLTGEAAYASNYIGYLHAARRTGATIEVVSSDGRGEIDVEMLESMIDDRVKLIALTHVPTNGGLVNPAATVGALANRHHIPYLLDACQSVGQLVVDVDEIGCDFLAATGRKFLRGPRGTGFLYARRSILEITEPPFLDLHGAEWIDVDNFSMRADARRYENWEFNYAAVLGLGAAIRYATDVGLSLIEGRVRQLAADLRTALQTLPGVQVRDLGSDPCAIVTFTHAEVGASIISKRLSAAGMNTSITTPASTRIDATRRRLPEMVRVAPHYFNTEAELEKLVAALSQILADRPG